MQDANPVGKPSQQVDDAPSADKSGQQVEDKPYANATEVHVGTADQTGDFDNKYDLMEEVSDLEYKQEESVLIDDYDDDIFVKLIRILILVMNVRTE